jgi:hypothetical protein
VCSIFLEGEIMATRGDLYIIDKKRRGNIEKDRFLISSNAFLSGMQSVLKDAMSSSVKCSLMNKIIISRPEMFELENTDVESGYTYEINAAENTIRAEYKFCSQYELFFEGSLEDFVTTEFDE